MSKWYEVTITMMKTVVIEVDDGQDADEAMDFAADGVRNFHEAIATELTEDQLDSAIRHADEVMRLD